MVMMIGDEIGPMGDYWRIKHQFLWKYGKLHLAQSRLAQNNRAPWAIFDMTDCGGLIEYGMKCAST
jgi:hypothetical protein